ncbi:MAG: FAD-dependent oxidoreductase [Bryobacteraceae bacterium]|nr:FAD-dependent oxidoreductase [Bryobacteraceae bacterium]
MPSVLVVGGGLAGLAAAAALGGSGFQVHVAEARPYPGGRATSYNFPSGDGSADLLDNCQHILLRCCTNLLDFYRRLGASDSVEWHRRFYFIEPGGRVSDLRAGFFPAPGHFFESFLTLRFLSATDKVALVRGMLAVRNQHGKRADLADISMAQWLQEQNQPEQVVKRFWRQVLVSAINEELDQMAASHGLQVIATGFLGTSDGYQMGVPKVTLGELYSADHWRHLPNVHFAFRQKVESVNGSCRFEDGSSSTADYYLLAVPFERAQALSERLIVPTFTHSPITSIHLWFDQPVTDLPHATLLDRTIHWMFNKGGGQHLQLVVSASRSLIHLSQQQIVDLVVQELTEFFPAVARAALVKSRVIKELRATFSAAPGSESQRPGQTTSVKNLFVAGDWTRTGWPATMEGAVRSGYLAAEAITSAAGSARQFVLP